MELIPFLIEKNIPFEENVPLSKKTWIKTGGMCTCWIVPASLEQLKEVCIYLYANGIVFDLVGQTSNIFFHSTYNPKIVVSTVKVNKYGITDDTISCECGVAVMKLAKDLLARGYAGFYGLTGLPGTVGAAMTNNAGCFNCSLSSMLIDALVLMPDGKIRTISRDDFKYDHRTSAFKRREISGTILSAKLKINKADNQEEELLKSQRTIEHRKIRQEGPRLNLGSIYAHREKRRNIRNYMAHCLASLMSILCNGGWSRFHKKALLLLYNYRDIDEYISDKKINTFIWRDSKAEEKFFRYKEFMGEVYKNLEIEIEEMI